MIALGDPKHKDSFFSLSQATYGAFIFINRLTSRNLEFLRSLLAFVGTSPTSINSAKILRSITDGFLEEYSFYDKIYILGSVVRRRVMQDSFKQLPIYVYSTLYSLYSIVTTKGSTYIVENREIKFTFRDKFEGLSFLS